MIELFGPCTEKAWLELLRAEEQAAQDAGYEEWAHAPEREEFAPGCFRKRCLPTADEQA